MAIEFSLLGGLELRVDGEVRDIGAAKQRAVLALLLLNAGRPLTAERIIDAVWGATPPATAGKNLQVLVGRLRATIEPDRAKGDAPRVLVSSDAGYAIASDACEIDVARLEALIERARRAADAGAWERAAGCLRDAESLWRGEPLGDLALEEWAGPHVSRLQEARLATIELRLHADLELGRQDAVVVELGELVAAHPLRERLRELQMLALYRSGRQADALEAYRIARAQLVDELGLEPGPALRDLERRILDQDPSLDPPARATRAQLPPVPAPMHPILGRSRELDELAALVVDRDHRLVTLTGWGGVGKTRTTIELVLRVASEFEDVAYLELAPLADSSLVLGAIEAAFGISSSEAGSIDALRQVVGDRDVLLVLDNFEHVLDAAPIVSAALSACPKVSVIVTSRTPLRIYGEREYALDALALPEAGELADSGRLMRFDAVQLFDARARAAGSAYRLDASNAWVIAQICARVDGLPLAIELAAARAKLLSPSDILARLDSRLTLLTTGPDDVADRQRSLRAAIAWSYDLLDDDERALLRCLGAFSGGCTVAAAIRVADSADAEGEVAVLDQLESLVSKNLLARRVDAAGEIRLSMLETIAEFVRGQLDVDHKALEIRSRHLAVCLDLTVAGNTHRSDSEHELARRRVRTDMPNIRSAARWGFEHDRERAGRLVASLFHYFVGEGFFVEGASLVGLALSRRDGMSTTTRAELLFLAGRIAHYTGRPEDEVTHLTEARELYGRAGDRRGEAATTNALGELHLMAERFDEARRHFDEALSIAMEIDDRWQIAWAETNIGNVAFDFAECEEATRRFIHARALFDEEGDTYWAISCTMNLALIEMQLGNIELSLRGLADARAQFEAHHHWSLVAHVRCNQLRAHLEALDFDAAVQIAEEAIPAARDTGDRLILCYGLSLQAVALLGAGFHDAARAVAIEALQAAVDTQRLRFVSYGMFVIARLAGIDGEMARMAQLWALTHADQFEEIYVLDRYILDARGDQLREAEVLGRAELKCLLDAGVSGSLEERVRELIRLALPGAS